MIRDQRRKNYMVEEETVEYRTDDEIPYRRPQALHVITPLT